MKRRFDVQPASGKTVLRLPAVHALFLQIFSFPVTLLGVFGVAAMLDRPIGLLIAAIIQGGSAAALSHWRGLAPWWVAIQFFFPVLLVIALSLQLPPSFFLFAFLFFLLLYWSTFRTQVPFYPSGSSVPDAVAALLPSGRDICFIDIGSGLGGLVLKLAGRFPDGRFTGIEIAPLPWLVSWMRARMSRSRAHFARGDYGDLDFAAYDVIFAYLSPVAMPGLWEKAQSEMREGALLLSYEFAIAGVVPSLVLSPEPTGISLYGFRIPAVSTR